MVLSREITLKWKSAWILPVLKVYNVKPCTRIKLHSWGQVLQSTWQLCAVGLHGQHQALTALECNTISKAFRLMCLWYDRNVAQRAVNVKAFSALSMCIYSWCNNWAFSFLRNWPFNLTDGTRITDSNLAQTGHFLVFLSLRSSSRFCTKQRSGQSPPKHAMHHLCQVIKEHSGLSRCSGCWGNNWRFQVCF